MSPLKVDAKFESGNIRQIISLSDSRLDFEIRQDNSSLHHQWFYFRLQGACGKIIKFQVVNAGNASYEEGWRNHLPVYSYDQIHWKHISESQYENSIYSFSLEINENCVYLAYFEPHTNQTLEKELKKWKDHPDVKIQNITKSIQGRPLPFLQIGPYEKKDQKSVWIIGRQHPGEPQGSACATGLIKMLLSESPSAVWLRQNITFCIVPIINPDGVALGNHRTNSIGVDLNRAWKNPTPSQCPTILAFQEEIKNWIQSHPVNIFIDMHSDEISRENVVYGTDAAITDQDFQQKQKQLLQYWQEENSDFSFDQSTYYDNLKTELARQWVFQLSGAISFTLELTYHDAPYSSYGNEPMTLNRCSEIGQALGRALSRYFQSLDKTI